MPLNENDQKFYEDQFDLFLHPGWSSFIKTIVEGRNKLMKDVIEGNDEAWVIDRYRGRLEALSQMSTYEDNIKKGYDAANKSNEILEAEEE